MFIGKNIDQMHSLPGGADESKSLAVYKHPTTYAENTDNVISSVDDKVDTVYAERVYLLNSLDGEEKMYYHFLDCAILSRLSNRENTEDLQKNKYLHFVIPEKNIKFIMPDGSIHENEIETESTLQIGCKVFDISRTDPLILSFT